MGKDTHDMALLLWNGFWLGLAAWILFGCDVDYVPNYTEDIEEQSTTYPVGPYGLNKGSTFPPLSLQDHMGQVVESDDMYPHASYWVVIFSTPTCAPCKRLYERRDLIEAYVEAKTGMEASTVMLMDPGMDLVPLTPTTVLVDRLGGMLVVNRVDGSFQKFETFLKKLIP